MKQALDPDFPTQTSYEVRFDWGLQGLRSIAPEAGVIVVIDAISFTTTVGIALEAGLEVVPYGGGDAAEIAAAHDAVVTGPRGSAGLTPSPSSFTAENVAAVSPSRRVLISSLNGSRLSVEAAAFGVPVIAASLRNRTALARWILRYQEQQRIRVRVAIVAAGEHRSDGTLRFSVEDLFAAGAVVDALAELGIDYSSPEAAAACAAFVGLKRGMRHLVTSSVTGQQMVRADTREDAVLAAAIDASVTVPLLHDGVFVAA